MKFSGIAKDEWPELRPYVDTCLLPVSGLDGSEQPWQATERLEKLQKLLDAVEIPFKGRVMIYPAVHYLLEDSDTAAYIGRICRKLKEREFRFVVLAAVDIDPALMPECADLSFIWEKGQEELSREKIADSIKAMWQTVTAS